MQKPNLKDKRLIDINTNINEERKKAQEIIDSLDKAKKLNRENFVKLFVPTKNKKSLLIHKQEKYPLSIKKIGKKEKSI